MGRFFLRLVKWVLVIAILSVAGFAAWLHFMGPAVNVPVAVLTGGVELDADEAETSLTVPEEFAVSVYATGIKNARYLLALPGGDLLVSSPRQGSVFRLSPDGNGDGAADEVTLLMDGLDRPHGLAFQDGMLYVAEITAVGRAPYDPESGTLGSFERIIVGLPDGNNHNKKVINFGPDGKLYLTIGSPCNVCAPEDARHAAMLRFNKDGSGEEMVATGLRNSVGFDWTSDGTLYATDNGRDLLGDDFPPEELNKIIEGGFYGWPHVNGFGVDDPDCGLDGRNAGCRTSDADLVARAIDPVHGFRAHNAPLGMTFVDGFNLPPEYRGAALVALHGSWNRSTKDGYKVVSLHFGEDGITERDFMTGFLQANTVIGRPVDVEMDEKGALFISDDYSGTIYKVVYGGEQRAMAAPTQDVLESEVFDADAIARGEELFARKGCAYCHVQDGTRSPGSVHELKDLASRYSAEDIVDLLKSPPGPMPRINMTDDERRALAAYLLSTY